MSGEVGLWSLALLNIQGYRFLLLGAIMLVIFLLICMSVSFY